MFKTEADVSKQYKEEELREEKWWISYLRIREDQSLIRADIQRIGEALNEEEALIKNVRTLVEQNGQAIQQNADLIQTNIEKTNHNADALRKNRELIEDVQSGVLRNKVLLDENRNAILDNQTLLNSIKNTAEDTQSLVNTKSDTLRREIEDNRRLINENTAGIEKNRRVLLEVDEKLSNMIDETISVVRAEFKRLFETEIVAMKKDLQNKWWWVFGSVLGSFVILGTFIALF